MLTAEQARGLNPETRLKSDMAVLDTVIRKAASEGKYNARVPYDLFETSGYTASFKCPALEHHLTDLGYAISVRSEDRQFVDVWIEISWGDTNAR